LSRLAAVRKLTSAKALGTLSPSGLGM